MARLSEDERQAFSRRTGMYVKNKCDYCGRPIVGCLTYGGTRGEYCRRQCLEEAEPRGHKTVASDGHKHHHEREPKMASKTKKEKKSKKVKEEEASESEVETTKKAKKPKDKSKEQPKKEKKKAKNGNPFRPDSAMAKAFDLAVEGTSRKALIKFCEKEEVGHARVIGVLRREEYLGTTWKFSEDEDGEITITKVK